MFLFFSLIPKQSEGEARPSTRKAAAPYLPSLHISDSERKTAQDSDNSNREKCQSHVRVSMFPLLNDNDETKLLSLNLHVFDHFYFS